MLDADQLRCVFCLLLSYPLAFLSLRISSSTQRHLYFTLWGVLYCQLIFGIWGCIHVFIAYFISYALMVLQLNLVGRRQWISILACVAVFAHLSFCHVYRQFYLENGRNLIDITGPMMVITIKVTSFAWNVYDGLLNDQNPVMTTKNVVALSQQSSWTLHTRITRLNFPSPLQYASYLLFFPSFLAGPAFDYTDFYAWTLPKDHHDTFKPSMERLRYAILYAALSLLLSTNVPLLEPFLDDPQNWSQSGHHSVLNALSHWSPFSARLIAMLCVNEAVMLKFYFIWIAAEGSCIAMGLGRVEKVETNAAGESECIVRWDEVSNVDVVRVQCSIWYSEVIRNWNKRTQYWLKKYVYPRVFTITRNSLHSSIHLYSKGSRFFSILLTYIVSAFWHGFHPGYYLAFVTGAVFTFAEEIFKQRFVRFTSIHKLIVSFGAYLDKTSAYVKRIFWIIMQCALFYSGVPFVLLSFQKSLKMWHQLYYFGHIWIVVLLFMSVVFDGAKLLGRLQHNATKRD